MVKQPGIFGFLRGLARILAGKPQVPASLKDNPLLKVIYGRRSVRNFANREIPADVFAAILEAGRVAPSTVNLQTWSFAVFDRKLWREVFDRDIPFHANRAVILIGDTQRARQSLELFPECPTVEYTLGVMNVSLAAMNMNIAAEALGVSSVMLSETGRSGLLDARYLKEKLELPVGTVPLMTMVFGYAGSPYPPMPPKLPLDQIAFDGKYRPSDPAVMADWMEQMVAGYKASKPFSSFERQLEIYRGKIGQAEEDLKAILRHEL